MSKFQPLAEVFGYPIENMSEESDRCRKLRICPYNNKIPNCSKDKLEDPLGVCSIYDKDIDTATVICPIRFRQDWMIIEDAAKLFFPSNSFWTTFTDIKLLDANGKSIGVIDFVLVSYDNKGKVKDFGILEVQASYVTQSLRRPFEKFMDNPERYSITDYKGRVPYADYTATIQRRLCPRLLYKGGIFHAWQKKMAIVIDEQLFNHLPELVSVSESLAEITWIVYKLVYDQEKKQFKLTRSKTFHTLFESTLFQISKTDAGPIDEFLDDLQEQLDAKLENRNPPDISISLNDIMLD